MNLPESHSSVENQELGEVLRRAQEIQDQTQLMLEPRPDLRAYVDAAEEAGIERDATMQALRERLSFPAEMFKPGEWVFAKSADGFFYVALLMSLEGRKATVQFLTGSDHMCDGNDLRLFSLTPGQKIGYFDKGSGMWWEGRLESFNRLSKSVTVTQWGEQSTLPLEKIRLPKVVEDVPLTMRARMWAIGIACTLGGGVAGAILMKLLMR